MNNHPNAELIMRSIKAWEEGDMETAASMIDDNVEWHEIGREEPIRGKAALAERFQGAEAPGWKITGGEMHDIIAGDDHTVALVTAHAEWGDKTLDYKVAEIYHIKDGKITARWAFSDDTEAINDFFKGT